MKHNYLIWFFLVFVGILCFSVVIAVHHVFSNVRVSPVRGENMKGDVYKYSSFEPSVITMVTEIDTVPNLPQVLSHISNELYREQIAAIALAYYPDMLQKVEWDSAMEDAAFFINNHTIMFSSGKLVFSENRECIAQLSGMMYPYSILPLDEIFSTMPIPRANLNQMIRSSDFQIAITGDTPNHLATYIKQYGFFNFRVRLHPIAGEALVSVEKDMLTLSHTDPTVMEFFNTIRRISGYVYRTVKGTNNISMHAFGLSLDLIPYSYEGKEAYWQWTKNIFPKTWYSIPLERRWLIPSNIVDIFQKHGFIWGGKWPNYDTIHFEYRPELIEYALIRQHTGNQPPPF